MTTQRLAGTLLIVALALMANDVAISSQGDKNPDLASLSDADFKTLTIILERTSCYGTCPAYTVTLHGDGRVEYTGRQNVNYKTKKEERVEISAIKTVVSEFAKTKFLSLPEDYSEEKCTCRRCTDMATALTEISVAGVTHRVKHYYGCACAPKALSSLNRLLINL